MKPNKEEKKKAREIERKKEEEIGAFLGWGDEKHPHNNFQTIKNWTKRAKNKKIKLSDDIRNGLLNRVEAIMIGAKIMMEGYTPEEVYEALEQNKHV